jgi:hypothetical protein
MEKFSEKEFKKLGIDFKSRGRKREDSKFYKMVSSLNVDEYIMIDKEDVVKETGLSIRSCRCLLSSKKRKESNPDMKGKFFSSSVGVAGGTEVFIIKRVK